MPLQCSRFCFDESIKFMVGSVSAATRACLGFQGSALELHCETLFAGFAIGRIVGRRKRQREQFPNLINRFRWKGAACFSFTSSGERLIRMVIVSWLYEMLWLRTEKCEARCCNKPSRRLCWICPRGLWALVKKKVFAVRNSHPSWILFYELH